MLKKIIAVSKNNIMLFDNKCYIECVYLYYRRNYKDRIEYKKNNQDDERERERQTDKQKRY